MSDLVETNREFAIFGASVLFANFLVLITFTSSLKLIEKYVFLIALSLADIMGGGAALSIGYDRMILYEQVPAPNATVLFCMKALSTPLLVIGAQWPSLMILIIGAERLLAVFKPIFYRANITNKHRVYFVVVSVIIILLYLSCAYGQRLIFGGMDQLIPIICGVTPTFLPIFDDIHRSIVIFGNLAGFFFTLIALLYARRLSKTSGGHGEHMRSEARRTYVFIIVSGFCVLQTTVPQVLFWLSLKNLFIFPGNTNYYNAAIFYTGSLVNLFIYLLLKKEFRSRFICIFTCGIVGYCGTGAVGVEQLPSVRNNMFQKRQISPGPDLGLDEQSRV